MEGFQYIQKAKLSNLPKAPGVYALASPKAVLYIGKAGNIRERVRNHFAQTSYRDNLFMQDVTKAGYIKTDSDIDALLLESQLIKKQQPKYNVMWKDDKKYFYIAITKEQLPRVFLTHQPVSLARPRTPWSSQSQGGNAQYIGPFTEGKSIKRVLRLLRRVFPYYTAKKHGNQVCQYCHLNLCPGPNPDKKAYKKNIKNLVAVLKGKRTSVTQQLEKEMKTASKNQDFEKAAIARDQFLSLLRIVSHSRLLSSHVSDTPNWDLLERELQKLLSTKKRIARIEAFDISNIQGKEATGSQVAFLKGVPAKEHYRKYKIQWTGEVSRLAVPSAHRSQRNFPREAKQLASRPNDFAMMQELLSRRLSHPEWPYPQLMVIDGGKGQLSAALKAITNLTRLSLPKLNLVKAGEIKVVALAKKHNELFFPGKQKPILLKDLPRPLENLFLHIRDEAHRFAVTYHRLLHTKKVIET